MFTCPRCLYTTPKKSSIKNHLNRKTICKINPRGIDINPNGLYKQIIINTPNSQDQIQKIIHSNIDTECSQKITKLTQAQQQIQQQIKQIQQQIKQIQKQIQQHPQQQIQQHPQQIKQKHIKLKPYRINQEYEEYIPIETFLICISKMKYCFQHFLIYTHFSPSFPQYNNIKITNLRSKYIKIWNGQKWILKDKPWIIDSLFSNFQMTFKDFIVSYNENPIIPHQKKTRTHQKINQILQLMEQPQINKEIKKELILTLYNNK